MPQYIDICSHNHKCECTKKNKKTKNKKIRKKEKNEEVYIDIKLAIMCFYITDREIYEKGKNKTIDREQKVLLMQE